MTVFNDIQAALDTQLSTITDVAIAYPNIPYTPSAGTSYLRASFIPADTAQASLGSSGKDETNGVYQVDVVVPRGSGRPSLVDTVADAFKRGTTLTYNSRTLRVRSVSIGSAILDDEWYFVPVSIDFQIYTEART